VALCTDSERDMLEPYLGTNEEQAFQQAFLVNIRDGDKVYSAPAQHPSAILAWIQETCWSNERLREREEAFIFELLLQRVRGACSSYGSSLRFSVEIPVTTHALATVKMLTIQHEGSSERGLHVIAVPSHDSLPFKKGWHFFTTASLRSQRAGFSSAEYSEILSPATSAAEAPVRLMLFTDYKTRIGLRGARRKWVDVAYGIATWEYGGSGPAPPYRGYVPEGVYRLPH